MTFEPLDVVVVPFPLTGRRVTKRRPALLVSSADFNQGHHHLILAMITSSSRDWPSDVAIRGWRDAGLNVPCKVRFKLFTLDLALIVRKIGTLSERDGEAVKHALSRFMAVGC